MKARQPGSPTRVANTRSASTPPPAHSDALGEEWRIGAVVSSSLLRNADLTKEQARVAAHECLKRVAAARLGTDPYRECDTKPIFLSGRDVPEATDNDIDALATYPAWVALNDEARPRTSWLDNQPACAGRGNGLDCDECPVNATRQGGQFASPPVSLRVIDGLQNQNQGAFYSGFLTACEVAAHPDADFLAIRIPATAENAPTFRVCNG